jgi:hypothetical protein
MRWLATLLLLLLGMPEAQAWNDRGHMLVAAVAYERLTPAVRQRVAVLLRSNPSYRQWVQGIRGSERTRTAFLRAATWPDAIKGAPGYVNDSLDQSGADPGPSEHNRTSTIHRLRIVRISACRAAATAAAVAGLRAGSSVSSSGSNEGSAPCLPLSAPSRPRPG